MRHGNSQSSNDPYAIAISNADFATGSLDRNSYVKANRLFTANEQIIAYKIGALTAGKINEAITKIIEVLQQ